MGSEMCIRDRLYEMKDFYETLNIKNSPNVKSSKICEVIIEHRIPCTGCPITEGLMFALGKNVQKWH